MTQILKSTSGSRTRTGRITAMALCSSAIRRRPSSRRTFRRRLHSTVSIVRKRHNTTFGYKHSAFAVLRNIQRVCLLNMRGTLAFISIGSLEGVCFYEKCVHIKMGAFN